MPSQQACRRPISDHRRLLAELYCLLLVFVPHRYNNTTRKLATLVIVITWATLELINAAPGLVTGEVHLPNQFYLLRLFVGILIGRMWGIQFNSIADYQMGGPNE